jgi:hypothetical protein
MLHYYKVRGIKVRRAPLPFVAIVLRTEAEYLRYMSRRVKVDVSGSLGVYLDSTNRIYLYDVTAGEERSEDWYVNHETIIHEAAHQTAFNIGVQRRFGACPLWVSEGIGTLFEAPGVWDSHRFPELEDRVNDKYLKIFRQEVDDSNALETIKNLIASDRIFDHHPMTAYATAWAMTFYATERQPQQYARYLERLYQRAAFNMYSSEKRMSDFKAEFGDVSRFAADVQSFFKRLN